jgi:hypothetical protein
MQKLSEESVLKLIRIISFIERIGISPTTVAEKSGLNPKIFNNKLSTFKKIAAGEKPVNRNFFTEDDLTKLAAWQNDLMNYMLDMYNKQK